MIKKIYCQIHKLFSRPLERGEYSGGFWQDKIRTQALLFCKNVQGRVLEIGCGEGLFLAQLAQKRPDLEIWGIDNSQARLQQAELRMKDKFIRNVSLSLQDATSLNFAERYFDTVICINVVFNLDSFDKVRKVFSQINRISKPGGLIILDFRNSLNPLLYFKYKLAPMYDQTVKDLPLKTYSLNKMSSLLRESGFEIINNRPLGFFIGKIAPIIILEASKI